MNLSSIRSMIPKSVSTKVGRLILHAQKESPHILFGAGVVGFAATTVLASRATLKVDSVLAKARQDLSNVDMVINNTELSEKHSYSSDDARTDRVYIYVQTGSKLLKAYAPTIVVGGLTIFAFSKAHSIQTKRIEGLMAAYAGLDQAFKSYRARLADFIGKDEERNFYYDAQEEKQTIRSIEPNAEDSTKEVLKVGPKGYSQYARFFDESSTQWERDPEYNFLFLRAQQAYANDLLLSRGHLFLNEVYDNLGLQRSRAGAVVGWIVSKDGDNFVDFGFMDGDNLRKRDFVNGNEYSVFLDFNVDGVIYDKI